MHLNKPYSPTWMDDRILICLAQLEVNFNLLLNYEEKSKSKLVIIGFRRWRLSRESIGEPLESPKIYAGLMSNFHRYACCINESCMLSVTLSSVCLELTAP